MTILTNRLTKHLSCAVLFLLSACGVKDPAPPQPVVESAKAQARSSRSADLRKQMEDIARATQGPVGAAVMLVETGEVVALNGNEHFPMQSVYKVPIAMAVLQRVDSGLLRLDQQVKVEPKDFVSYREHSIQGQYPRGAELSVGDLLRFMVSESDGTACDALLRLIGGPEQAAKHLRDLGAEGIVVAKYEKEMAENPVVSYQNWSTPEAMLGLLKMLQEGRGLSATSRDLLLDLMIKSRPGPRRIKGLLPAGAIVAHKTGTSGTVKGQNGESITTATNDVGVITLPDGHHLAVAIFVSETKADEATREGVIAKIARAAWDYWVVEKRAP